MSFMANNHQTGKRQWTSSEMSIRTSEEGDVIILGHIEWPYSMIILTGNADV